MYIDIMNEGENIKWLLSKYFKFIKLLVKN